MVSRPTAHRVIQALGGIVMALAVAAACGQTVAGTSQPAAGARDNECVRLSPVDPLAYGSDLVLPLPRGLELRLKQDGPYGWWISVGVPGMPEDFIWPVSPPYRFAPHLAIGPVYGMTPAEAARLPRDLRFVLTTAEQQRMADLIERQGRGELTAEGLLDEVRRVPAGSLTLRVTDFAVREKVSVPAGRVMDAFEWIRLEGEACVPRPTSR